MGSVSLRWSWTAFKGLKISILTCLLLRTFGGLPLTDQWPYLRLAQKDTKKKLRWLFAVDLLARCLCVRRTNLNYRTHWLSTLQTYLAVPGSSQCHGCLWVALLSIGNVCVSMAGAVAGSRCLSPLLSADNVAFWYLRVSKSNFWNYIVNNLRRRMHSYGNVSWAASVL